MHSKALAHQAPCLAEEPSTKASKYTPGQSPRAVLTAQEHTVSTGPAVPPGGVGGVGGLRMPWWASGPPAAPRDSTPPSSQAIVPLLRARGASRVPAALESITLKQ